MLQPWGQPHGLGFHFCLGINEIQIWALLKIPLLKESVFFYVKNSYDLVLHRSLSLIKKMDPNIGPLRKFRNKNLHIKFEKYFLV